MWWLCNSMGSAAAGQVRSFGAGLEISLKQSLPWTCAVLSKRLSRRRLRGEKS